jgi:hypothetical protein
VFSLSCPVQPSNKTNAVYVANHSTDFGRDESEAEEEEGAEEGDESEEGGGAGGGPDQEFVPLTLLFDYEVIDKFI